MSYVAVGVAVAGIASSAVGARKSAKESKKAAKKSGFFEVEQAKRRDLIARQLESIANKLLNEQPVSPREQALIAATAKVADTQLQKIQKESIESGLEAQAGTGFLKSGRMSDQVRRLTLEGAEGRSRIAIGREQAINDAIARNRSQALQALGMAGGFQTVPQFQQPVGNPLAAFGAGLTSIGSAGVEQGGFSFGQKQPLTQVNPATTTPTTTPSAISGMPFNLGAT